MSGKSKGNGNQNNRGKGIYSNNNIARTSGRPIRNRGKSKLMHGLKVVFILLAVLAFLIVAGGLTIAYSYVQDAPEFNPEKLVPAVTSHIFDRFGNEITHLYYDQNRDKISLDKIPLHVRNAFIAIEDERFFDHIGVDPIGIARALFTNLRQLSWTEQGGSTITQQLIKTAFLTPEKTLERKVQEAYLALKMERRYSKDEILELYLNHIPFGHGSNGIEVASNIYFGKSTGELSIAEAALLAAIPRAPSIYSPFNNKDESRRRQELVLQRMYDLGFITREEWRKALDQEIVLAEPPSRKYLFPYFADYVLHHELMDILLDLGLFNTRAEAQEAVYHMGLRIFTTLDPEIQDMVQSVISNNKLYPQNFRVDMQKMNELLREAEEENDGDNSFDSYPEEVLTDNGIWQPQGAVVVADPSTGEVLALVGGRDYGPENQVLRYLSTRQPGSAIKTIVTYAPAMEEGLITPGSLINDAPLARGDWKPENFDGTFRGLVTVRESLVRSLNIPAVRAFEQLTPKVGIDYARRMGLTTIHADDYNLVTTLGGMRRGVTAFDMAQAYAVLANEGIKIKLHTIKRIEDRNGQLIYEQRSDPQTILSPQTAYLINDILQDAVSHGTASRLRIGRPVAAKTGTTDDNRDAYLVAYTPDLVVSLWLGHDIPILGHIRGGSRTTLPFMQEIMSRIFKNREPLDFVRPPGIVGPIAVCSLSGLRPGTACPATSIVSDLMPAHLIPQDLCNQHIELEICRVSGLLAGSYCPLHDVETKTFRLEPERITNNEGSGATPAIPGEYCNLHLKPAPPPMAFNLFLSENPLLINLWWEWQENVHEYLIYRSIAGSDELILLQRVPGNTNHFADQTVSYGATYTYRVISVTPEGIRSQPAERTISVPQHSSAPNPPFTFQE